MAKTEEGSKKKRGKGTLYLKIRFLFLNYFLLSEKTILMIRMMAKGGMKGWFPKKDFFSFYYNFRTNFKCGCIKRKVEWRQKQIGGKDTR